MLQITIIGNIGKDAEIKEIGGKNYVKFSVAHSEGKDKPTTWVTALVFANNPEKLSGLFRKGAVVFVQGRLTTSVYEGKVQLSVWADQFKICKYAEKAVDDLPSDDDAY